MQNGAGSAVQCVRQGVACIGLVPNHDVATLEKAPMIWMSCTYCSVINQNRYSGFLNATIENNGPEGDQLRSVLWGIITFSLRRRLVDRPLFGDGIPADSRVQYTDGRFS